jgi:membrane protein
MSKKKENIISFALLFKRSFIELGKNDPLRMAGATAFFTTFALPPIMVILIQMLGLFFTTEKIRGNLFETLGEIIGEDAVQQVIDVLIAFREMANNIFITIGGFVFLLFVATTLFHIISGSLNQLWKIRSIHKRKVWEVLRNRIKSVAVILVAGLLFVIGLISEALQAFVDNYIFEFSPLLSTYFNNVVHYSISVFIVTLWFAVVFRYLPDGRPNWRVALTGGLVTSILFNAGKILLRYLLGYSNINNIYGASGSIVLLLLFVFYSSLILYYGAVFTKLWASHNNKTIQPLPHAQRYILSEAPVE